MAALPLRVLLIEDDQDDYLLTRDLLGELVESQFELQWVENYAAGLNALMTAVYDVALVDFRLGAHDGIDLVRVARQQGCTAPLILLTTLNDRQTDLAAMQAGASDFLSKRDITAALLERSIRYSVQQRRLEHQRIQLLEEQSARALAEKANEAKSRFLANISHELRTPMNAIIGMNELALQSPLSDDVKDYLQTALESSHHLLALLNELLDFSRLESGNFTLEEAPFNLRETVEVALKALAVRARSKGLSFDVTIDPAVPDRLIGDALRVRQLLANLVGNAVKFTAIGGIATKVQLESATPAEAVLRFAIHDTGIGIAPAAREGIFQPFTQADASTTRRFGGTGLGLTIAASLVEMMHGRIWLESEVGQGSTFFFHVRFAVAPSRKTPAAPTVAKPATLATSDGATSERLQILLAEDTLANQKLIRLLLERRGHDVIVAADGAEAVQLAAASPLDLILMDVQMPELNGFQATTAIRASNAIGRNVPIVALTAHALPGDEERCLEAGMNGYLSKPIDSAQLYEMIDRFCNRSSKSSADIITQ